MSSFQPSVEDTSMILSGASTYFEWRGWDPIVVGTLDPSTIRLDYPLQELISWGSTEVPPSLAYQHMRSSHREEKLTDGIVKSVPAEEMDSLFDLNGPGWGWLHFKHRFGRQAIRLTFSPITFTEDGEGAAISYRAQSSGVDERSGVFYFRRDDHKGFAWGPHGHFSFPESGG